MSRDILLEPAGYSAPGGAERINDAIQGFMSATAEVANFAETLLQTFAGDFEKCGLAADPDWQEHMAQMVQLIDLRAKAQDEMLRAIAGRKAAA